MTLGERWELWLVMWVGGVPKQLGGGIKSSLFVFRSGFCFRPEGFAVGTPYTMAGVVLARTRDLLRTRPKRPRNWLIIGVAGSRESPS